LFVFDFSDINFASMRVILGIVSFLLLATSILFGQNELNFNHLSIKDGFVDSKANAIIQDQKGFIWIGTWNGLNRYDGYSVKTYQPSFHDSTTITNREVVELLEDRAGNIWIGTSSGLNRLNPSTGQIMTYDFQNRIIALHEDHENQLWIGTWNGGLFKLDPETGERNHYLSNEIISDIHEDSRGMLWVASYNGLVRIDGETGAYQRYLPGQGQNSISNGSVTQITESADGILWIGTWGGGLNKVTVSDHDDSLHFTHYWRGAGGLSSDVIYKLFYDDYQNLWIGTWNDGLNLLKAEQQDVDPENARFLVYQNSLNDPTSLSGNGISSLMVDRSGVLWIGAATIDRTSIIDTGIKRYKVHSEEQAANYTIRAMSRVEDQLWMGSNRDLRLYHRTDDVYEFEQDFPKPQYKFGQTEYIANSILSLAGDSSGLWVGTEDAGLIHYPADTDSKIAPERAEYFNQQTSPEIPGNKVSSLVISKKQAGVIWIGTLHSGLAKMTINKGQKRIKNFGAGNSRDFLSDNNIRIIYEDSAGLVWIGTQNGLNCFNPETSKFEQFFYSVADTSSINDNIINAIYEDSNGALWVGTNSGLNKVIRDGTTTIEEISFQGYPSINNLSNEVVTHILEDDSKNLWIRLYSGIVKFNLHTEDTEYFLADYENGSFERNTSVKADDGLFIIGNPSGFISFYPDSLYKLSVPPKVCITDLLIYNESVNARKQTEGDTIASRTVPYRDQVHLSHTDKMLTFMFSAMDYSNPAKNSYYYQLEGFDNDWNEIGSRNTATYTNIPPGKYIFKVKATNNNGIWSEEAATLHIQIRPPWWKTTWAYLFYILIFIGLLYFFQEYSFIKAHAKSELMFEKLKNDEMYRLNEMKSNFFTDITHELRTPLTLILGPAKELMADKTLSSYGIKQAGLIQKSANKLLRMVNELMEFRKVEMGVLDHMHLQRSDLAEMINEVYLSFKPMAESRGMKLNITIEQSPLAAFVDPDKIEKVLFNLVSNAFKYSPDGGRIDLRARLEEVQKGHSLIRMEVEDTGIGIEKEHIDKVFGRFYQVNQLRTQSTGGIGLFLSKALVEQHQGRIEVRSEPGKGSCFSVILPIQSGEEMASEIRLSETAVPADETPDEADVALTSRAIGPEEKPLILVVEDDTELNEFLVSGLSSEFRVMNAYNGQEGLEKTRAVFPDLVISDIMMPKLDGFELCQQIRKDITVSHIPLIFLTAKTMHEDEIKGLRLGAVDYIFKPFDLLALKLKIQNIFDIRRTMHERIKKEQILQPETVELPSLDEIFLKNAVESVNKHLDDSNFDVELFATDLGVSMNNVYRKIKALTGQTAKEFIRNQRLKHAAGLLVQQKRSISEIIYMVGFASPSYFTRCFKEFYGCTPKEYIERYNKQN